MASAFPTTISLVSAEASVRRDSSVRLPSPGCNACHLCVPFDLERRTTLWEGTRKEGFTTMVLLAFPQEPKAQSPASYPRT